jgi:succinate dehydrogenase/fumarate reductase flavoprotein subunit
MEITDELLQTIYKRVEQVFRKWLHQSDDYACAKNERERQKIINNGVRTQEQMETNLKEIENLLR